MSQGISIGVRVKDPGQVVVTWDENGVTHFERSKLEDFLT